MPPNCVEVEVWIRFALLEATASFLHAKVVPLDCLAGKQDVSSHDVMLLDPCRMSSEQIHLAVGDGWIIARGGQRGLAKMFESEFRLDACLVAALDEMIIDRIDMSGLSVDR